MKGTERRRTSNAAEEVQGDKYTVYYYQHKCMMTSSCLYGSSVNYTHLEGGLQCKHPYMPLHKATREVMGTEMNLETLQLLVGQQLIVSAINMSNTCLIIHLVYKISTRESLDILLKILI